MKLFSRNKVITEPEVVINKCLKSLFTRISDSLEDKEYHWNKSWGVKRFESLVLSKFFMEYAFQILSDEKLKDDEKLSFYNICENSFSTIFNDEFSSVGLNYEDMQEDINSKINSYLEARKSSKPPHCWHQIYQLVTKSENRDTILDAYRKVRDQLLLRIKARFPQAKIVDI